MGRVDPCFPEEDRSLLAIQQRMAQLELCLSRQWLSPWLQANPVPDSDSAKQIAGRGIPPVGVRSWPKNRSCSVVFLALVGVAIGLSTILLQFGSMRRIEVGWPPIYVIPMVHRWLSRRMPCVRLLGRTAFRATADLSG